MKKVKNSKVSTDKKRTGEEGELKKPTKLKPLKEKEKKGWKNKLGEEEDDDLVLEDDVSFSNTFEEEEEDYNNEYYDDGF